MNLGKASLEGCVDKKIKVDMLSFFGHKTSWAKNLLIILVGFSVTGCYANVPLIRQIDVTNLSKVFGPLEVLKVEDYRNQDWCKNIAYQRGKFSENLESTTCNLFEGQPKPMDDRARQDFQVIARSVAATGVNIDFLSAQYSPAHRLIRADFQLSGFCRCSYVYSPRYHLPQDLKGEMEFTAINADWYFVWEDWN